MRAVGIQNEVVAADFMEYFPLLDDGHQTTVRCGGQALLGWPQLLWQAMCSRTHSSPSQSCLPSLPGTGCMLNCALGERLPRAPLSLLPRQGIVMDRLIRALLAGIAARKQGITDPLYVNPERIDHGTA